MTGDDWGPWVEHDGGPCPLPKGTIVEIELTDPHGVMPGLSVIVTVGEAYEDFHVFLSDDPDGWRWSDPPYPDEARITRCRVRRPSALLDLIRAATNPVDPVAAPSIPVRELETA